MWRILLPLVALLAGCATAPLPTPEDTLPRPGGSNTAYYRFRAPGSSYGQDDLLGQVFFNFDQAALLPDGQKLLRTLAANLEKQPEMGVSLVGYCDWYGKEGYNLALGQRRADAVAAFLRGEGVAPERIRTESRGAKDSPIGLPKRETYFDRRVDILFLR